MNKILGWLVGILAIVAGGFKMKADRLEKQKLKRAIAREKKAREVHEKATEALVKATAIHEKRKNEIPDTELDDFLVGLSKRSDKDR